MFPDPATHFIRVTTSGLCEEVNLSITDAAGQLIRPIARGTEPVDISDLPRGIYFIRADHKAFKLVVE